MKRDFNYVEYGEPHAKRRKTLIKQFPEIKNLMGYDPMQAIPVLIIVPTQIVLAKLISVYMGVGWLNWWTLLIFSYLVGSILMHWLAMAIHETSHDLIFKKRWQNKLLGIFANISIPLPFAMTFHKYHPRHHTFLGVDDIDADLPQDFEVRLIGKSRVKKFFWWLFNPFFYAIRGAINSTPLDKWEKLNFVVITLVTIGIYFYVGWIGMAYLAMCTYFGMGPHPVAAHFIHEHYLFDGPQETYSYYGPLNKVTYNVGYHNEHHDFYNVPGSKLPELRKIMEEDYASMTSHTSWIHVLWNFISRKDIGLPSRLVRTRDDFFADMKGSVTKRTHNDLYR